MSGLLVVTVTHNSADVLPRFLDSYAAARHPDMTLVIVDSGSSDDTVAIASAAGAGVEVVPFTDNIGVARGNNVGIRRAHALDADTVVFLNNDTAFEPDFFTRLRGELDELENAVWVPTINFLADPGQPWFSHGLVRPRRAFKVEHNAPTTLPRSLPYAPTCCLAIRVSDINRVGHMDEDFFVYCDDTDFCCRLAAAGIGITISTRTTLLHDVSALTGGVRQPFGARHATRNRVLLARKYGGRLRMLQAMGYLVYHALRRLALGVDRPPLTMTTLKAILEGARLPDSSNEAMRTVRRRAIALSRG